MNDNLHPVFKDILAPFMPEHSEPELLEKSVVLGADLLRKNQILMDGYNKIGELLLGPGNITKRQISDILIETLDQIS